MVYLIGGRDSSNLPKILKVNSSGQIEVVREHTDNVVYEVLFADAVRAATVETADFTNPGYLLTMFVFSVTVVGGGGDTVQLRVTGKTPLSAQTVTLFTGTALTATGLTLHACGLGAVAGNAAWDKVSAVPLPHTWSAKIPHSGVSNFNYTLEAFHYRTP
jgi:hypothetical protein